jgi:hypothetical protein
MNLALCCAAPALIAALASLGGPPAAVAAPPPAYTLQEHEPEFLQLSDEFDEAQQEFFSQYEERWGKFDHETASEAEKAAHSKWWQDGQPAHKFLPRFEALAVKAKGTDVAIQCYGKVLDMASALGAAGSAPAQRALKALNEHLGSPAMEPIAQLLQYAWGLPTDEVRALLGALREKSPHRPVQAAATFSLAQNLMSDASSTELRTKARALLVDLGERFADVKTLRGATYGSVAANYLFELDHLQVGMVAPDMEALDVDGAKFRLSDFRGKVTVVDFWGYW